MTDAQFGLLTSVFLWVYALLSPSAGYLADRFSRSRVIIGSLFVWSAVTWLTAHAHDFNQLLVARALMGVSEACYIPAALALITDYHRGPTRSLATGLHMSGLYAGAALGGLGGVLAENFKWQSAFNLFGAIGVVYSVLLIFALRETRPTAEAGRCHRCAGGEGQPGFRAWLSVSAGIVLGLVGLLRPAFHRLLGDLRLAAHLHGPAVQARPGRGGNVCDRLHSDRVLCRRAVGGAWADRWCRSNLRGRVFVPLIGFCAGRAGALSVRPRPAPWCSPSPG